MEKNREIASTSSNVLGVSPVLANIKFFIQVAIAVSVFSVTTPNYAQSSLSTDTDKSQKTEIQYDSLEHQRIINMNVDSLLIEYGEEKWMEIIREHMLIEVNKLRIEHGKQPLVQNDTLNQLAQNHSQYMYENDRYSHKDKEWHNANRRMEKAGIVFTWIAKWWENIAKNYHTIQGVLYAWMNSPWHRANILFVDWEALWTGYDVGFWTQDFY